MRALAGGAGGGDCYHDPFERGRLLLSTIDVGRGEDAIGVAGIVFEDED